MLAALYYLTSAPATDTSWPTTKNKRATVDAQAIANGRKQQPAGWPMKARRGPPYVGTMI
jgi:hypothetical protein